MSLFELAVRRNARATRQNEGIRAVVAGVERRGLIRSRPDHRTSARRRHLGKQARVRIPGDHEIRQVPTFTPRKDLVDQEHLVDRRAAVGGVAQAAHLRGEIRQELLAAGAGLDDAERLAPP